MPGLICASVCGSGKNIAESVVVVSTKKPPTAWNVCVCTNSRFLLCVSNGGSASEMHALFSRYFSRLAVRYHQRACLTPTHTHKKKQINRNISTPPRVPHIGSNRLEMATSSTAIAQHTLLGRSDDFDSRFLTAQAAVVVLRGLTGAAPGSSITIFILLSYPSLSSSRLRWGCG